MEKQPPVDNEHVASGCERFSPETIALNAPAPSVPDVVREYLQLAEALEAPSLQEMTLADIAIQGHEDLPARFRSAADLLTAQAKTIEGLERDKAYWQKTADGQTACAMAAITERDAAEATVTAQAAEVAKLQKSGGLTVNCLRLGTCSEKTHLEAERRGLLEQVHYLETACSKINGEVSQTLGLALGYPKYTDDQKNFPGASGDTVCVGDHVAESLATEAAKRIAGLETEVERLTGALTKINAVRDSIIGLQKLDWSEHVYPLVAALGQAGIEGLPYPEARANVGTLIERATSAESSLETARGALEKLEKAVCTMLAQKTDRMRNGIEMDDGEKGYIVHSDDIYALEVAVAKESDE